MPRREAPGRAATSIVTSSALTRIHGGSSSGAWPPDFITSCDGAGQGLHGSGNHIPLQERDSEDYDQWREIDATEDHRQVLADPVEERLGDCVDKPDDRVIRVGLDPR